MIISGCLIFTAVVFAQICVNCHRKTTPNIVSDWKASRHSKKGIDCSACHGDGHKSAKDTANVLIPTIETCAPCHKERVRQFKSGKHEKAWTAMKALPTAHFQLVAGEGDIDMCADCHKIGLKTETEIMVLKKAGRKFGVASCDSCHTRHLFSVKEAREPQACNPCHSGGDNPQWQIYSSSKHGVRYLLKQSKTLPEEVSAPTCQTCHMQDGNHTVSSGWGFFAVRLPSYGDSQWADDQAAILKGLGLLDPDGRPAPRLDIWKEADLLRITHEDWQKERDKMEKACNQCHSINFVKAEIERAEGVIKQADQIMAEAIGIVASLYKEGLLRKPPDYVHAFPDLFKLPDEPSMIEKRLNDMFYEHRMKTFQGALHSNPDYVNWYGLTNMKKELMLIRILERDMRREAK